MVEDTDRLLADAGLARSASGGLHAGGAGLAEIAAAVGTPTYVYHGDVIEARFRDLTLALSAVPHTLCYAIKANSTLAVLRLLAELGAGADIVSTGEMLRALRAGFRPERIVFSGVGKRDDELLAAMAAGIGQVNVESLEEVARCLDEPGMSLARVVGLHIEQLTRRLELERELLRRLEMVRAGLAVEADVSVEKLLEIMEVMNMFEKHYSPEQLAELEARRDQLGPEGMARAQQQWTDLLARVDKAVAADLDPRDPAAREMAREWDALIQGFTGGNKAIEQSLKKMYGENPDVAANHGFRPDPRVMAWLARARD